jgi:hypothetical protein
MSNEPPRFTYYLRDQWTSKGRDFWARRSGEYPSEAEAVEEAKRLAKGIGKGARVQVMCVSTSVVAEVSQ